MDDPKLTLPLREYIDREIKRAVDHQRELAGERERFLAEKFLTIEEARKLARIDQDRRLEGMNEFREQLTIQAQTFETRELHDRDISTLRELIGPLATNDSRAEGRATAARWFLPSGPALISLALAGAAFVIALLNR